MGNCIFCGAKAKTREHTWAKWLRPHVPMMDDRHTSLTSVISKKGVESVSKIGSGDFRRVGIRCVCGPCNGGWMGRLQTQAKPDLLGLINMKAFLFDLAAQPVVAAWVAMFVMASEFRDRDRVAISQADRNHLHQSKEPPPNWHIWIAAHQKDEDWASYLTHHVFHVTEDTLLDGLPTNNFNTQISTFAVGPLLVHAMSSALPSIFPDTFDPLFENAIHRIWPPFDHIVWPPTRWLKHEEASFVANAFMEAASGRRIMV